jgi:hypothetical protein
MLKLITAVAVALVCTAPAAAGGWATVGLNSFPAGIDAGETWNADLTVLRHGVTPTDGARPSLTIRNGKTGKTVTFAARPTGKTGHYAAHVVFPEPGTWAYSIDNGLEATGYGASATTTYAAVRIGGGAGGGSSVPAWPIVVGGAVLVLGAGAVLVARRRREPVPSH